MSDLDLLLTQLDDEDNTIRIASIKAIQHFDDARVLSALKLLVTDESITVVRSAILAIGNLGGCEDLPFLLPLMQHNLAWVRKATVQALGQTGCQDAVPHLVNLLGDEGLDALAREALVALKVDPDFF